MPEPRRIKRALISVYDKTGIVDFARALHDEFGIELISTGGTAKVLKDAGLPVTLVEDITGFPEMLDGRVKTLHPRIHAAILADRDNPEHMRQLAEQGIEPIDMVVVNLYPFEQTIAKPGCTFAEAIEMIDIGGPCLLRAAAKNHKHVWVLCDREDWVIALDQLRRNDLDVNALEWIRLGDASATFGKTTDYDRMVADYLAKIAGLPVFDRVLEMCSRGALRYGENPHQAGELMRVRGILERLCPVGNIQTEVSFNNYADASAALELCAELTRAGTEGADGRTARLRLAGPSDADRTARLRLAAPSPSHRHAPVRDDRATRRKLPHWQTPGATYWITFRSVIGVLNEGERRIAFDAMRFWDGKKIDIHALVVMPDHVHVLLSPRTLPENPGVHFNLSEILTSVKSYSGRLISQGRGGLGQTWDRESYDHQIRDESEFRQKWEYIAQNPVKEGLAATPDRYPWWYGVDFFVLGIGRPVSDDVPVPPVLGGPARGEVRRESCKAEPCSTTRGEEPCSTTRGEEPCSTTRGAEPCSTTRGAEPCDTGGWPAVCFIKHTNACGVAGARPMDDTPQALHEARVAAYRQAYLGDPNAAMGGILAVNFPVDAAFAAVVMETYARFGKPLKDSGHPAAPGGFFVEVWLAPDFTPDAVAVIRGTYDPATARPEPGEPRLAPTPDAPLPKKDWGQRVRLLAVGDLSVEPDPSEMDLKRIAGGVLMQTRDLIGLNEDQWQVVTERAPTERELHDLRLAWLICKHTKSNAITICRDGMLLGNGAGQMSRVMSCRIATWLARENGHEALLPGAVAASDAFFPFRDGPDLLIDVGITALIQPGGSKRDADTIAACNERGVAMIFTGTRHFRH